MAKKSDLIGINNIPIFLSSLLSSLFLPFFLFLFKKLGTRERKRGREEEESRDFCPFQEMEERSVTEFCDRIKYFFPSFSFSLFLFLSLSSLSLSLFSFFSLFLLSVHHFIPVQYIRGFFFLSFHNFSSPSTLSFSFSFEKEGEEEEEKKEKERRRSGEKERRRMRRAQVSGHSHRES